MPSPQRRNVCPKMAELNTSLAWEEDGKGVVCSAGQSEIRKLFLKKEGGKMSSGNLALAYRFEYFFFTWGRPKKTWAPALSSLGTNLVG